MWFTPKDIFYSLFKTHRKTNAELLLYVFFFKFKSLCTTLCGALMLDFLVPQLTSFICSAATSLLLLFQYGWYMTWKVWISLYSVNVLRCSSFSLILISSAFPYVKIKGTLYPQPDENWKCCGFGSFVISAVWFNTI